ncbi:hypothetical protein CRI94_00865 [Longibacter salinarum]|uniref:RDD domain-containing protein n=1 Tax=Longibacter salinarum TaxID=1850348 RepID=A0A2A8D2K1_9BACT|nr:RDD family protein [Longibacter salinarum]PEN14878.1 hypothetical protein CRI94_00865 [Longibacter salinarum]
MQNVDVQTAQNVSLSVELAGVGTRLFASIIDYATLIAYFLGATLLVDAVGASSMGMTVLIYLPIFVYFLGAEVMFDGQSIGKHVMDIRVRNLDGTAPSFGAYAIRWLLRPVDIMFSSGFLGLISILVTQHAQRLGDLAAGTTVVRQQKHTKLRDLSYLETTDDHDVTFEQVDALDDHDIQIARDVLNTLVRQGRTSHTQTLGSRTQEILAKKMRVAPSGSPIDFLRTVIEDYNHIHARA